MVDSDDNDKFDLGVKGLFVLLIFLASLPSALLTMPIAIGPLTSKSDLHVNLPYYIKHTNNENTQSYYAGRSCNSCSVFITYLLGNM